MGYILRIGFRHLDAIRSQTVACVAALHWYRRQFSMPIWLEEQMPELITALDLVRFPEGFSLSHLREDRTNYALALNTVISVYAENHDDPEVRAFAREQQISTTLSDHVDEDDKGSELGGAWTLDPFPIRAGIVLSLGALEGFERGVIRILTATEVKRPGRKRAFRPRLADFLRTNPVWEDLERRRRTFTRGARAAILAEFDVPLPDEPWRRRLDAAWAGRNRLVHGFESVAVSLPQFLQTQYDCFSAMRFLAAQCLNRHCIDL